jgi:hypothetical protein
LNEKHASILSQRRSWWAYTSGDDWRPEIDNALDPHERRGFDHRSGGERSCGIHGLTPHLSELSRAGMSAYGIAAELNRRKVSAMNGHVTGARFPIRRIDTGCNHVNDYLARRSHGIRQITILQDFRAAEAFNESSLHRFAYAI